MFKLMGKKVNLEGMKAFVLSNQFLMMCVVFAVFLQALVVNGHCNKNEGCDREMASQSSFVLVCVALAVVSITTVMAIAAKAK